MNCRQSTTRILLYQHTFKWKNVGHYTLPAPQSVNGSELGWPGYNRVWLAQEHSLKSTPDLHRWIDTLNPIITSSSACKTPERAFMHVLLMEVPLSGSLRPAITISLDWIFEGSDFIHYCTALGICGLMLLLMQCMSSLFLRQQNFWFRRRLRPARRHFYLFICYETMSNYSQNCWIDWNSAGLCFKRLFHKAVWTFARLIRPLLATIPCIIMGNLVSAYTCITYVPVGDKKGGKSASPHRFWSPPMTRNETGDFFVWP